MPSLWANSILFDATELVAASKTKGNSVFAGTATAIGFVPNLGSAPKVGKTATGVLVIHTPIMS